MYRFWINCRPPRSTGQATKKVGVRKNGKPFSYTSARGKSLHNEFMSLLMPYVPLKPLEGPLCMEVRYALPFLKTERKAIKEKGWVYHDKKPDADNLLKVFQDIMERLNFFDKGDSQLVDVKIVKIRSEKPGIGVKLYPAHTLSTFFDL
jgi:Holliday junction resolvase RusA-like endonuclease